MNISDMHVTVSPAVRAKMEERKRKNINRTEVELEFRDQLNKSFQEAYELSNCDPVLSESVKNSISKQLIIPETAMFADLPVRVKEGKVILSQKRTLEAAAVYKRQHIAVLNFASAIRPGGGINKVSLTQEECLMRESTLFSCLNMPMCEIRFYDEHKDLDYKYNADMIYTPDVTVFRTYDKLPKLMPKTDWLNVDMITMAAPNLEHYTKSIKASLDNELINIFELRSTRIMQSAVLHDVDVLILGAFGCGAFHNDPGIVATGAARALERYRKSFDTVEFAIYETGRKKNHHMFRLVLDRYLNNI